jgi:hypothetical protein
VPSIVKEAPQARPPRDTGDLDTQMPDAVRDTRPSASNTNHTALDPRSGSRSDARILASDANRSVPRPRLGIGSTAALRPEIPAATLSPQHQGAGATLLFRSPVLTGESPRRSQERKAAPAVKLLIPTEAHRRRCQGPGPTARLRPGGPAAPATPRRHQSGTAPALSRLEPTAIDPCQRHPTGNSLGPRSLTPALVPTGQLQATDPTNAACQ